MQEWRYGGIAFCDVDILHITHVYHFALGLLLLLPSLLLLSFRSKLEPLRSDSLHSRCHQHTPATSESLRVFGRRRGYKNRWKVATPSPSLLNRSRGSQLINYSFYLLPMQPGWLMVINYITVSWLINGWWRVYKLMVVQPHELVKPLTHCDWLAHHQAQCSLVLFEEVMPSAVQRLFQAGARESSG